VRAFLRSVHVVEYSRDALGDVAGHVETLADAEDLPGHGAAVAIRFGRR
jgi:histidinol dehydrogenase